MSFLNIFHIHLHPIQNSSAWHFLIPVENELLFCSVFSVNYEEIKCTYIFLPNSREFKFRDVLTDTGGKETGKTETVEMTK